MWCWETTVGLKGIFQLKQFYDSIHSLCLLLMKKPQALNFLIPWMTSSDLHEESVSNAVSMTLRKTLCHVSCLPIPGHSCQVLVFSREVSQHEQTISPLCNGWAANSTQRKHAANRFPTLRLLVTLKRKQTKCSSAALGHLVSWQSWGKGWTWAERSLLTKQLCGSTIHKHYWLTETASTFILNAPFLGALECMFGSHFCAYVPVTSSNTALS